MTWFRNEHIYHWLDASKPLVRLTALHSNDTLKILFV